MTNRAVKILPIRVSHSSQRRQTLKHIILMLCIKRHDMDSSIAHSTYSRNIYTQLDGSEAFLGGHYVSNGTGKNKQELSRMQIG